MEAINILVAGIGAFITLIFFAALAPMFNVAINLVLANSVDPITQLLIQFTLPVLVFILIISILEYRTYAPKNLM